MGKGLHFEMDSKVRMGKERLGLLRQGFKGVEGSCGEIVGSPVSSEGAAACISLGLPSNALQITDFSIPNVVESIGDGDDWRLANSAPSVPHHGRRLAPRKIH